ncbi:hypothetical protein MC885_021383 [Smutsia gigantea]|nr:hypothetical protein MC885_021383 [Smutsia gigantea]
MALFHVEALTEVKLNSNGRRSLYSKTSVQEHRSTVQLYMMKFHSIRKIFQWEREAKMKQSGPTHWMPQRACDLGPFIQRNTRPAFGREET